MVSDLILGVVYVESSRDEAWRRRKTRLSCDQQAFLQGCHAHATLFMHSTGMSDTTHRPQVISEYAYWCLRTRSNNEKDSRIPSEPGDNEEIPLISKSILNEMRIIRRFKMYLISAHTNLLNRMIQNTSLSFVNWVDAPVKKIKVLASTRRNPIEGMCMIAILLVAICLQFGTRAGDFLVGHVQAVQE
jgi:hypothetical protein